MWPPCIKIYLKPSETKDPDKGSSDFRDLLIFSSAKSSKMRKRENPLGFSLGIIRCSFCIKIWPIF